MANQHREKLRGLRGVDDDLWRDFAAATECANTDRSAALRAFMEWYVRRPYADHPRRPAAPEAHDIAT
ncbi:hypothetical protein [Streptomyces formicae]